MGKIKIDEKEFILNKVRFKNTGGVSIEYQMETERGTPIDCSIDSDEEAHPDMTCLLDKMKEPVVFTANGFASMRAILSKKNLLLKSDIKEKAIKDFEKELTKEMFSSVRVTGVHFYHINDGIKVKITGGFDSPLGYAAINTPQIGFDEVKHGFEEELEKVLKTLQEEVYKYVVENKRAQLEMFDDKAA